MNRIRWKAGIVFASMIDNDTTLSLSLSLISNLISLLCCYCAVLYRHAIQFNSIRVKLVVNTVKQKGS